MMGYYRNVRVSAPRRSSGPNCFPRRWTISSAATKMFGIGLTCLFLTACASTLPQVLVKTEVVKQYPPSALTQETPPPEEVFQTNGDLLTTIERLRAAMKDCNDDKAALREWAN